MPRSPRLQVGGGKSVSGGWPSTLYKNTVKRGICPSIPTPGELTTRQVEMEITDTAEGRCRPIHYGRFRFSAPLVHAELTSSNTKLELIALIGEGPIVSVDHVWVDEVEVYPSEPAWADVEIKLGGSLGTGGYTISPNQTASTIITNATIDDWTHPGQAYVAIVLTLASATTQGAIPRIEVAGTGVYVKTSTGTDSGFETLWAWTENPIWCLRDALTREEYAAGYDDTAVDAGGTFLTSAGTCSQAIESTNLYGQTNSNQQLALGTYDRLQSFKAIARSFKVVVKLRTTSAGTQVYFPMVIRTSKDGADILPDVTCAPITSTLNGDFELWGAWNDSHGFVPGTTYYLVHKSGGVALNTGKVEPDTVVSDGSIGILNWIDVDHVQDGVNGWAHAGPAIAVLTTEYLKCTNFGFAVPTGATIQGVKVEVTRCAEGQDSIGDWVSDNTVKLTKGGSIVGNNKADTVTTWPDNWELRGYGGASDLWGTTLTVAEVNASTFGIVLAADVSGPCMMPGNYANVERVEVTVYYIASGGGQAAITSWHHNSLTDAYTDGGAEYKNVTWQAVNYDHWFKMYWSEEKYRCALTVLERSPVEDVVLTLLRTCHGRLGWWDGKWRATLDESAAGTLVLSDNPDDSPDILCIENSLVCGTSEGDQPNFCASTYYDVSDWTRKTVRYHHSTYLTGNEQPKELRQDGAPVPSGGQLYRLLGTWINRARRQWKGSCRVPQHGIRLAPGDKLVVKSKMWTGSRVVMLDEVTDERDGTFSISFTEWDASDFVASSYDAQTIIATSTTA